MVHLAFGGLCVDADIFGKSELKAVGKLANIDADSCLKVMAIFLRICL